MKGIRYAAEFKAEAINQITELAIKQKKPKVFKL
jgi:hypothetical protein